MAHAFLFAGQGAQVPGMAGEIRDLPRVKRLFELADSIRPGIVDVMLTGTREQLAITENTQPCMFLADLAYAYAREDEVGLPAAVCGFSVGEVPALTYAGVLTEADGFRVIAERARLMQQACEKKGGAMAAVIGLAPEAVEAIAAALPEAWAVNYNAPLQTVVACAESSLPLLTEAVAAQKGRTIRLNVSGAFHCPYMAEAGERFGEFLQGVAFAAPHMPVYANRTGLPYEGDFAATLAAQMVSPVRFTATIAAIRNAGIEQFYEVGPGKVLSGLVAKILQ